MQDAHAAFQLLEARDTVPEPPTVSLLTAGVAASALVRKRPPEMNCGSATGLCARGLSKQQ